MNHVVKPSILVVCGATATGKSNLAVRLAKLFDGEIINADIMQIYSGLNIITNKMTAEERCGIPHHLFNMRESFTKPSYLVGEYQRDCLRIIANIHARKKIAIIVGGTHYYIESVLWHTLINEQNNCNNEPVKSRYQNLNNHQLHMLLSAIDYFAAERLHPNDRRKVLRSLEVCHNTADSLTSTLKNQTLRNGSRRYSKDEVLILWTWCPLDTTERRINDRLVNMENIGLREELQTMDDTISKSCSGNLEDFCNRDILQSIGFKEFMPYLLLIRSSDATQQQCDDVFQQCLSSVAVKTRQYAIRQIRWIENRFLRRLFEDQYFVVRVDTTNASDSLKEIVSFCTETIEKMAGWTDREDFINCMSTIAECRTPKPKINYGSYICSICDDQLFITDDMWKAHLASRRHHRRKKSTIKRAEKQLELQEYANGIADLLDNRL